MTVEEGANVYIDNAAKEVVNRLDEVRNRVAAKVQDVPVPSATEQVRPPMEIVWWPNVIGLALFHITAVYGAYLSFYSPFTFAYMYVLLQVTNTIGMLMGAHRYYAHKSFTANMPLQCLMMLCNSIVGQNCMYAWVRDHRQHHKYSDTNADPHNATRGFFFSHVGWLMVKKHPDIFTKGKNVDLSDLARDPLVMFQKRNFWKIYLSLAVALPMAIPMIFWGESFKNAFFITYALRNTIQFNYAWMVNSWAHAFGTKPYDKTILPSQTFLVALLANGEGWHNYHHTFPWDYKASEYGLWNPTTFTIDLFAKLGWAYDLKQASGEVIHARAARTGDGSYAPSPASATTLPASAATPAAE